MPMDFVEDMAPKDRHMPAIARYNFIILPLLVPVKLSTCNNNCVVIYQLWDPAKIFCNEELMVIWMYECKVCRKLTAVFINQKPF
jgi:hypothetical protein